MKLYKAETQIGSYFLTVIETTPAKAMQALKREYELKQLGHWKCGGRSWRAWVDYCAITPQELEIGQVAWS